MKIEDLNLSTEAPKPPTQRKPLSLDTLDLSKAALPEVNQGLAEGVVHAQLNNPDGYALARRLAADAGVPPDVAARNPEQVKRAALQSRMDALHTNSPKSAEWMAEKPERVTLAGEDDEHLSMLDKIGEFAQYRADAIHETMNLPVEEAGARLWKAAGRHYDQFAGTMADWIAGGRIAVTDKVINGIGRDNMEAKIAQVREVADRARARGHSTLAEFGTKQANFWQGVLDINDEAQRVHGVVGEVNQQAREGLTRADVEYWTGMVAQSAPATIAAMFTGGVAAEAGATATAAKWIGSGAAGVTTYLQSYAQARGEGMDPEIAHATAGAQAVIETFFEAFGMGKLFSGEVGSTGRRALSTIGRESVGEAATTVAQTTADAAITGKQIDWGDLGWQTLDSAIVGGLMGGPEAVGTIRTARTLEARQKAQERARRVVDSTGGAATLASLQGVVADMKVTGRSAEEAASAAEALAGGGKVYVDAEQFRTLYQGAALDPQAAALELTGDAAALPLALAAGGDLAIPLAKYLAIAGPSKVGEQLQQHARLQAEHLSPAELSTFDPAHMVKDILGEPGPVDEKAVAERTAIRADIHAQLTEAKVPAEAANRYADLYSAVFGTLSQRSGIAASELWAKYGLRVRRGTEAPGMQQGALNPNQNRGILDANGQLPAHEELATAVGGAPREGWASHTRVVGSAGTPAVVYRGSRDGSTSAADFGALGAASGNPTASLGVWFTSHQGDAARYGSVSEYALDLRNPMVYDIDSFPEFDGAEAAAAHVQQLQAQGYDGIVFDTSDVGGPVQYIAFAPESVIVRKDAGSDVMFQSPAVMKAASAEQAFFLANTRAFPTGRDFKIELQDAVLKAADGTDLAERNDANANYLTQMVIIDAERALAASENAVGWYDEKVSKALATVALIHPEIATDPMAKFAFTWALAVTSNGLKVDKNFQLAEDAYTQWKATGKMGNPIGVGTAKSAINESLLLFDELAAKWGMEKLEQFMTTQGRVGDIQKATGVSISGEAMGTQVFGAAVLGPKIGNGFFANLYGHFGQLTMDRWLMRTWGRWTGTLIEINEKLRQQKATQLAGVLRMLTAKNKKALEAIVGGDLSVDDPSAAARLILQASTEPDARAAMNLISPVTDSQRAKLAALLGPERKGNARLSLGAEVRKISNMLAKYEDGQKEAPEGPKERDFIRQVFGRALEQLQATRPDLTMADLQAVLWYPEKRLYEAAKKQGAEDPSEAYNDDEAPDYANAAAALAQSKGVDIAAIESAWKEIDNGIAARKLAAAAGRGVGGAGPGAQPGQAAADAGADAGAVTDTPEFRAWFGDSKVVDSDGKPLVVYHGTNQDITEFLKSRSGLNTDSASARGGFFFTANVDEAGDYAAMSARHQVSNSVEREKNLERLLAAIDKAQNAGRWDDAERLTLELEESEQEAMSGEERGANIVPVYLSISNPMTFDMAGKDLHDMMAAIKRAKASGHDGMKLENVYDPVGGNRVYDDTTQFVAFEPTQIKSAIGNRGTFDPANPNILYQPAFRSALTALVERMDGAPKKADAKAWKGWLDGAVRRGEIKQSERDWVGVDAWLDSRDTTTREELQEFVRLNEMVLTEDVLSGELSDDSLPPGFFLENDGGDWAVLGPDNEPVAFGGTEQEALRTFAESQGEDAPTTQFAQYTLPGGENYREIILKMPPRLDTTGWRVEVVREDTDGYRDVKVIDAAGNVVNRNLHKGSDAAIIAKVARANGRAKAPIYRSSHWAGIDNPLVHLRVNERVAADGVRTLFVEEVQSDLMQEWRRLKDRIDAGTASEADKERFAFLDTFPFAGTEQWALLGFKRAVRYAAEHGITRIAWTTGEQQAERYDLSKVIDYVEYEETDPGKFYVRATDHRGGHPITEYNQTPAQLEAIFGKEVADKIAKKEGAEGRGSHGTYGTLRANNLRVGGEGMRGFYDNILPKAVGKWAKKFGAKVGQMKVGAGSLYLAQKRQGGRWYVLDNDQPEYGGIGYPSYEKAKAVIDKHSPTVHSIDITPEMRDAALAGLSLFQNEDAPRGSIELGDKVNINLFAGADLSTFLHESGHFFLEVFGDLASADGATAQIKSDYAQVLRWFGVSSRDEIETRHHEQFARGFEAYLAEGRAPAPELNSAFARFRDWIMGVYKQLTQLNVQLTDEVRGVFDRLIATDDAISQAQAQQFPPLTDAKALGLTEAQFETYVAMLRDAKNEAVDSVIAGLAREDRRQKTREWKAEYAQHEQTVRAELDASPLYRTISLLRTGKLPDGSEMPGWRVKLSKADLLRQITEADLEKFRGMYWVESGTDAEVVALKMGFASGTDMLDAIMKAVPKEDAIKAEATKRMQAAHPSDSVPLPEQAMRAVHNNARVRAVEFELRALAAASQQEAPKPRMLQAVATFQIGAMKVSEIKPNDYAVAERRAAAAALKAAAAGKYAEAFVAKRQQALNLALYRAAKSAVLEAEKARRFAQAMGTPKMRGRMGLAGQDILDQIDTILAQYSFKPMSRVEAERRQAVARSLQQQVDDGTLVVSPRVLSVIAADQAVRWDQISVDQLREVNRTLQQLRHQGLEANRLRLETLALDRAEVDADVAASILDGNKAIPVNKGEPTRGEKFRAAWGRFRALQATATDAARELDGFVDGGPVWAHTVRVIRDAVGRHLNPALDAAGEALSRLYLSAYSRADLRALEKPIAQLHGAWSRQRILALALNWGNDGNREAILTEKDALTPTEVQQLLGHLTAKDWDFVEGVWHLLDSYWPQAAAVERRRTGLVPEKVLASPFTVTLADGSTRQIAGGYYPLKRAGGSARSMKDEEADRYKQISGGRTGMAKVPAGSLIERVGFGGERVRLDLGVIQQHIESTLRIIHLSEPVTYVDRVLNGPMFTQAVNDTGMVEHLRALRLWLKDAAVGEMPDNSVGAPFARALRTNFTAAALTWKFSSAALQVTGVFQTAPVVGWARIAKAVNRYYRHPIALTRYVFSVSPAAHARSKTLVDAVQKVMDARASGISRAKASMIRWGYYMIAKVQMTVDVATFLAAEEKGLDMFGGDVAKARSYAEDVLVRAQGPQDFIDKTPMQRGTLNDNVRQSEWIRAATMLGGYMLAKGNVMYEITRKTNFKKPGQALQWGANMTSLFVMEQLIAAAIKGQLPDDEDDDGWFDDIMAFSLKEGSLGIVSSIPGGNAMANQMRGYDSGGILSEAARLGGDAWEQYTDGDWDKQDRKVTVKIAGLLTGAPTGQINKTLDAIDASSQRDVSPMEYINGPRKKP